MTKEKEDILEGSGKMTPHAKIIKPQINAPIAKGKNVIAVSTPSAVAKTKPGKPDSGKGSSGVKAGEQKTTHVNPKQATKQYN